MDLQDLSYGFKRAKMSWYTIDPILRSKPDGISNDLSLNATRRIFSEELYPLTDIAQGQSQVVNTLDLTYYPSEEGRTIVQTLQLLQERIMEES
jgi:cell surface protein SprA